MKKSVASCLTAVVILANTSAVFAEALASNEEYKVIKPTDMEKVEPVTSQANSVDDRVEVSEKTKAEINARSIDDVERTIEDVEFSKKGTKANNTNPNNALFIPENYYELALSDTADSNDRWYAFTTNGSSKITTVLSQAGEGDYDLYLYELNGSSLNLVDYSVNQGGYEKIDYLGNGTYFLRINPYIASSTPYNYQFTVNATNQYDSNELNETYLEAEAFEEHVSVSGTIDNMYDEDWYLLKPKSSGDYFINNTDMMAKEYAVFIYDKDLKLVDGFLPNNANTNTVYKLTGNSEYYIRISSYYGNYQSKPYNLFVGKKKDYYDTAVLPTGDYIEYTDNDLYINGVKANINGVFASYSSTGAYYKRTSESLTAYKFNVENVYNKPYYTDNAGWKTAKTLRIRITDGFYHGTYSTDRTGMVTVGFDTDPNRVDVTTLHDDYPYMFAYIDLSTGKVVDTLPRMQYNTDLYSLTFEPGVEIN